MTARPFLAILLLAATAFSEETPIHAGLPEWISARYVEENDFVDFRNIPGAARAPLGFSFAFNGTPLRPGDQASLKRVFSEQFLALLPKGTRIEASTDSQGRPLWDYPAGAQAIHLITWNDPLRTVFELRLIQKRVDGRWAFGVYIPLAGSPGLLRLRTEDRSDAETIPVQLADGARIDVSFQRLEIGTCRRCHFNTTSATRPYPSVEYAGPCQFVPDNPDMAGWIRRYLERRGEPPVEDRARS